MVGTLLERMIFWELVKVFVLSLLGITGILLMAGIVAEATQQGLSPAQILAIIPLLIPSTLPYTIPATTLFATCVVYGRLACDNEILAIRASGISIALVLKPAVVLGLAMSAATMALYYEVIPYTHHLMRSMFLNDFESVLYAVLKKNGSLQAPQTNYSMFVQGVQGRKLINATFKRRDARGQTDFVAQAKEAELRVDMTRNLLLVHMKHGVVSGEGGASAYFLDRVWEVPLPDSLNSTDNRRARDMTWEEIKERRAELEEKLQEQQAEIAVTTAKMMMTDTPNSDLPAHVNHLRRRARSTREQILALDTEVQMRPALSLGCLCFVIIGCPVGIWFGRSDFLSSFITCFLPIVFIYYPLVLCGTNMAKSGTMSPYMTLWGADVLMGGVGLILFWRLLKN